MRYIGQRTVAPRNPDSQWPAAYLAVLREAGAHEKTLPHCVAWVRGFFVRHPGRRRRDLGRPQIEAFLAELAGQNGVENRHVQQAREALELYYERFRGIALAPRSAIPKPHAPSSPAIPPPAPSAAGPLRPDMRRPEVSAGSYQRPPGHDKEFMAQAWGALGPSCPPCGGGAEGGQQREDGGDPKGPPGGGPSAADRQV